MNVKKLISVCLSAAMVFSSFAPAFSAEAASNSAVSKFTDTEGHWASAAIEKWSDFHVLNGSEGLFRPDGYITRAEMATLLDNMMGYQKTSKNSFSDVPSGAWYTTAVLKANAAGILNGDGSGHANPTERITREQAALMLARAFSVDDNQGSTSKFTDQSDLSSWAKSMVFGMEAAGYISGYNNQFNPQSNITRAEVVTIIDNAVKGYYTETGTYTQNVNGLAVVKAKDVVIKDASIGGNLIIAEGVADGDATLDSTTVNGALIVRGGGENSVIIKGDSHIDSVLVEKQNGKVRIFADGVVVGEVEAYEEVILEGAFGSVTITENATVTVKGTVATLDIEKSGTASIQSGTVTTLNAASGATASIASAATVKTANLTGAAEINGTGKIETANISGTGAVIAQTPSKVTFGDGASATISGKETSGSVQTTTGSGSSGRGSGGSNVKPYTLEEIQAGKVLRPFTLVGSFDNSIINNVTVAAIRTAYMWDKDTDTFKEASSDKSTIVGNFTELYDLNNDKISDGILIVKQADSADYWNADQYWLEGIGLDSEPLVTDETGQDVFGAEHVIPMGERQLTAYGLGDYSGVTDFSNIIGYNASPDETTLPGQRYYWPQHDYYNAASSSTLTMLTNYKTYLQTTGANCGPASVLTALDWFGQRGDLNDNDLVALREKDKWGGASSLRHMINIFENLSELELTSEWEIYSSYDNKYALYDTSWIQETLAEGYPIMVGWNSFGGHWQVIIGYDNMGTETGADDVLILMDPYDSTDHRNDGYNIQSAQRLADGRQGFDDEVGYSKSLFLVAKPVDNDTYTWDYAPVTGGYTIETTSAAMDFGAAYGAGIEKNWIPYRDTANDIYTVYPDTEIWGTGDDKLAGPATGSYRHSGDVPNSSYYSHFDFYNIASDTVPGLTLLENFRTIQQATEWTCGLASALMSIEWFGENQAGLTEIDLAQMRSDVSAGATSVNEMEDVFSTLNEEYGGDWAWFTMRDLSSFIEPEGDLEIGGHYLEWGAGDDGLIPYLLSNGIPMMIGWDEWGGHWQVIIGYDDMGTYETQDDILILADPYDTTDHNMDGYVIESFERLVYGWNSQFEGDDYAFIVAFPASENPDIIQELGLEAPYFTQKKNQPIQLKLLQCGRCD